MPGEPSTKPPPFDGEAFARESEARLRASSAPQARTTAKLGAVLAAVPVRTRSREDEGWFTGDLERTNGLVLGAIDDKRSVAEIASALRLTEVEALRAVFELVSLGLVSFR
jgi:hypothetical protein